VMSLRAEHGLPCHRQGTRVHRVGSRFFARNWVCACCREDFSAKVQPLVKIPKEPHQDERIDPRFDEPVVAVEAFCFVVLGVDEQDPYPDRLGHLEGLEHEVLQESCSQSMTLVSRIDRHARQEDGGHLFRLNPSHPLRCRRSDDGRRRRGVESDDFTGTSLDDDSCAAQAARLVRQRVMGQPLIERRLPAVEPLEDMLAGQQLRTAPRL
jgi:hypothetical protein